MHLSKRGSTNGPLWGHPLLLHPGTDIRPGHSSPLGLVKTPPLPTLKKTLSRPLAGSIPRQRKKPHKGNRQPEAAGQGETIVQRQKRSRRRTCVSWDRSNKPARWPRVSARKTTPLGLVPIGRNGTTRKRRAPRAPHQAPQAIIQTAVQTDRRSVRTVAPRWGKSGPNRCAVTGRKRGRHTRVDGPFLRCEASASKRLACQTIRPKDAAVRRQSL